ncbi:NAD(P)/FAD-dependent oxidoreductase [Mitsuokella sp. AF21-1AC]|uniref:NAD(P)/FAD-dependent oxidoreductase n=1 Tax=Mitsuokella sp. AF21-1AC TaxID=2292235 RepID=UPI000E4730C0|nr:FAD-dependent oxidoreductase [Mitsuokella sp. AF21-1AC]RGS70367.1 FAD-binding protein [Mitsuokella sp. AF21-1AC]
MAKETVAKDVVIIGAGMAGLTAALYAGRSNLSTIVLENELVGGQIANATGIENYPGFMSVKGGDLMATVQAQAEAVGVVVDEFDLVKRVNLASVPKIVETEEHIYEAKTVILATGMKRRKMPLPEAARYEDRGIHYCELCDGHMYQDKVIVVMGGGNAAVDAANYLTRYAKKLYLIHRSELRADEVSQKRLYANPAVTVMLQTEITALAGEKRLESIQVLHKDTGKSEELPVDAIFVNIGVVPNTELFRGQIRLTESGRIPAGEDCRTEIPGVFAAGDVREKEIRQLTTAAADGTTAALLAERYIRQLED